MKTSHLLPRALTAGLAITQIACPEQEPPPEVQQCRRELQENIALRVIATCGDNPRLAWTQFPNPKTGEVDLLFALDKTEKIPCMQNVITDDARTGEVTHFGTTNTVLKAEIVPGTCAKE